MTSPITSEQVPALSLAERDRRWALARELMAAEDVDALVAYGERECAGVAPFAPDVYFSNDRPGAIVIFVREAEPISLVWSPMSVCDHIEARGGGIATWIEPSNIRVAKHAGGVVDVLRENGLEKAAVGVLGLEAYPPFHVNPPMPYGMWTQVLAELPEVTFKPVMPGFIFATVCLSEEELACVRYSAAAGDAMALAMQEAAVPGVSEAEVYAAGLAAACRRGASASQISMRTGPGFAALGPPPWVYRPQPPRTLENGDVIMAAATCRFAMYETCHQVAVGIGDIHPDIERAVGVARDCYDTGLEAARPGNTFGDLVGAMCAPLDKAGGWRVHPMVHSMNPYTMVCGFGAGLSSYPRALAYGQLAEVATFAEHMRLAPGMTFAFQPNCVFDGKLASIGGTVIIGEDGPIELNPLTARLLRA
jgi:Xaa-Pro aminopeptidase